MSGVLPIAKLLWTGLTGGEKGRIKSQRRKARLGLECLESRRVFTADGHNFAILDFDGEDLTAAEMNQGGWGGKGAVSAPSFNSLFNSSRPFLDMNADAKVDNNDAQLAIARIMAKVREDYSPYDLTVQQGDQDNFQHLMTSGAVGDVIVMITGGGNILDNQNALGLAPGLERGGNAFDEIVWVFGGAIANNSVFSNADKFVNAVAQSISHEMGHSFGLEHAPINVANADQTHLIMAVDGQGGQRDFKTDFNFQDIAYPVEGGGTQNSHQLLTGNLGESANPWLAVLKPGELMIKGSEASDNIRVTATFNDQWEVSLNGVKRTVITGQSAFSLDALNVFSAKLNKILVFAKGSNDIIQLGGGKQNIPLTIGSLGPPVETVADAGAGDDTVYGSSGRDTVYGGIGNDIVYGAAGDDFLYGQAGLDQIFGGSDDDWLDGGADDLADILRGEGGNDTFVRYQKFDFNGLLVGFENENTDFNASGSDLFVTRRIERIGRK